jgi:hypothetical protein
VEGTSDTESDGPFIVERECRMDYAKRRKNGGARLSQEMKENPVLSRRR